MEGIIGLPSSLEAEAMAVLAEDKTENYPHSSLLRETGVVERKGSEAADRSAFTPPCGVKPPTASRSALSHPPLNLKETDRAKEKKEENSGEDGDHEEEEEGDIMASIQVALVELIALQRDRLRVLLTEREQQQLLNLPASAERLFRMESRALAFMNSELDDLQLPAKANHQTPPVLLPHPFCSERSHSPCTTNLEEDPCLHHTSSPDIRSYATAPPNAATATHTISTDTSILSPYKAVHDEVNIHYTECTPSKTIAIKMAPLRPETVRSRPFSRYMDPDSHSAFQAASPSAPQQQQQQQPPPSRTIAPLAEENAEVLYATPAHLAKTDPLAAMTLPVGVAARRREPPSISPLRGKEEREAMVREGRPIVFSATPITSPARVTRRSRKPPPHTAPSSQKPNVRPAPREGSGGVGCCRDFTEPYTSVSVSSTALMHKSRGPHPSRTAAGFSVLAGTDTNVRPKEEAGTLIELFDPLIGTATVTRAGLAAAHDPPLLPHFSSSPFPSSPLVGADLVSGEEGSREDQTPTTTRRWCELLSPPQIRTTITPKQRPSTSMHIFSLLANEATAAAAGEPFVAPFQAEEGSVTRRTETGQDDGPLFPYGSTHPLTVGSLRSKQQQSSAQFADPTSMPRRASASTSWSSGMDTPLARIRSPSRAHTYQTSQRHRDDKADAAEKTNPAKSSTHIRNTKTGKAGREAVSSSQRTALNHHQAMFKEPSAIGTRPPPKVTTAASAPSRAVNRKVSKTASSRPGAAVATRHSAPNSPLPQQTSAAHLASHSPSRDHFVKAAALALADESETEEIVAPSRCFPPPKYKTSGMAPTSIFNKTGERRHHVKKTTTAEQEQERQRLTQTSASPKKRIGKINGRTVGPNVVVEPVQHDTAARHPPPLGVVTPTSGPAQGGGGGEGDGGRSYRLHQGMSNSSLRSELGTARSRRSSPRTPQSSPVTGAAPRCVDPHSVRALPLAKTKARVKQHLLQEKDKDRRHGSEEFTLVHQADTALHLLQVQSRTLEGPRSTPHPDRPPHTRLSSPEDGPVLFHPASQAPAAHPYKTSQPPPPLPLPVDIAGTEHQMGVQVASGPHETEELLGCFGTWRRPEPEPKEEEGPQENGAREPSHSYSRHSQLSAAPAPEERVAPQRQRCDPPSTQLSGKHPAEREEAGVTRGGRTNAAATRPVKRTPASPQTSHASPRLQGRLKVQQSEAPPTTTAAVDRSGARPRRRPCAQLSTRALMHRIDAMWAPPSHASVPI